MLFWGALGVEIPTEGPYMLCKASPASNTSTRANSPGGSSSTSSDEVTLTDQLGGSPVEAGLRRIRELMLSDNGVDSAETLAQRRRVRELVLNDLGVDVPETSSAPSTKQAPSTVRVAPASLAPCLAAPRTPPPPAHTPCVGKTPTCVASIASACDVLSASPACQSVTLKGGDASQRSPAPRPGFDASQRTAPARQMGNQGSVLRMSPTQPLGAATPMSITSPSINIVSTCPAARKASTQCHDASARSPTACPGVKSLEGATTTPLNIVSTCPTAPKSSTPSHDASARSPAACLGSKSPVDATISVLNIVSTCPTSSKSTTPSHDASARILVAPRTQVTPAQEPGDAVKVWLSCIASGAALRGDELAEKLRAAAPEMYED